MATKGQRNNGVLLTFAERHTEFTPWS